MYQWKHCQRNTLPPPPGASTRGPLLPSFCKGSQTPLPYLRLSPPLGWPRRQRHRTSRSRLRRSSPARSMASLCGFYGCSFEPWGLCAHLDFTKGDCYAFFKSFDSGYARFFRGVVSQNPGCGAYSDLCDPTRSFEMGGFTYRSKSAPPLIVAELALHQTLSPNYKLQTTNLRQTEAN